MNYEEALRKGEEVEDLRIFRVGVLAGLKSIDINLDLIRKALVTKKKKNAKR